MSTGKIPSVAYLNPIEADNTGSGDAVLHYDGLTQAVVENARYRKQREAAMWDAEIDTVAEIGKARQLGFEYFVATAEKVITSSPQTRDMWADRYTNACMELFGEVDPKVAARLAGRQKREFDRVAVNSAIDQVALHNTLSTYSALTADYDALFDVEVEQQEYSERYVAQTAMNAVLYERYASVMDLTDDADTDCFTQPQLVELFEAALAKLSEEDSRWKTWKVSVPEKGTGLSVNGKKKQVIIPRARSSATASEALKLMKHELLCHGLRSVNGKTSNDKKLGTGYPNYFAAEEGLGIIFGTPISGEIKDTIFDRYIDITLAVGRSGLTPLKRQQLTQLVYDRHVVRAQIREESFDRVALREKTLKYVDRIFRGSPGDDIGSRQDVYTADIYYYVGYEKMNGYISERLAEGFSASKIFDYVMQGKFDPTDAMHTSSIGELT